MMLKLLSCASIVGASYTLIGNVFGKITCMYIYMYQYRCACACVCVCVCVCNLLSDVHAQHVAPFIVSLLTSL